MRYYQRISLLLLILVVLTPATMAGTIQSVMDYQSTVSSDANGALDLKAELNYNNSLTNAPIAVVMHQYSNSTGLFSAVRDNAQRLRDEGFFVISVAMRGREGSDGTRDSGGVEIHDIYDAVETVKSSYSSYVDTTNIHITGYSGGGGNAMSALTKFPDYFRLGSAFFGMSDYGYDSTDGWYNNGAGSGHKTQLDTDIGNPNTGGNDVEDRYHARASNLASKNNPYSEIRLFVNNSETLCPKINDTKYRDNAGSSNITVHLGQAGTYEDFNSNGQNDDDEQQYWPHNSQTTTNEQAGGEGWYLDRLLAGSIAQPVLNSSDELFVGGFVKTKPFGLWLGDGQNAAGDLTYSLSATKKQFNLTIATHNQAVTGKLTVDTADMAGKQLNVLKNGTVVDTFTGGGTYEYNSLGNGDNLVLCEAIVLTDFESPEFNTGNVNGQNGWAVVSGSGQIVTDYVIEGSQSLNVSDNGSDGKVYKDFENQTSLVTVECDVKNDLAGDRVRLELRNGDTIAVRVGFGSGNEFFAIDGDGNGGYNSSNLEFGSWDADTVYTFKVIVDIENSTFDLFINNDLLADDYGFWYAADQLGRFWIEMPDNGSKMAIDNLTITPEPATMTLLLIGLPFALRRKR